MSSCTILILRSYLNREFYSPESRLGVEETNKINVYITLFNNMRKGARFPGLGFIDMRVNASCKILSEVTGISLTKVLSFLNVSQTNLSNYSKSQS
jgi:hypothetical protein